MLPSQHVRTEDKIARLVPSITGVSITGVDIERAISEYDKDKFFLEPDSIGIIKLRTFYKRLPNNQSPLSIKGLLELIEILEWKDTGRYQKTENAFSLLKNQSGLWKVRNLINQVEDLNYFFTYHLGQARYPHGMPAVIRDIVCAYPEECENINHAVNKLSSANVAEDTYIKLIVRDVKNLKAHVAHIQTILRALTFIEDAARQFKSTLLDNLDKLEQLAASFEYLSKYAEEKKYNKDDWRRLSYQYPPTDYKNTARAMVKHPELSTSLAKAFVLLKNHILPAEFPLRNVILKYARQAEAIVEMLSVLQQHNIKVDATAFLLKCRYICQDTVNVLNEMQQRGLLTQDHFVCFNQVIEHSAAFYAALLGDPATDANHFAQLLMQFHKQPPFAINSQQGPTLFAGSQLKACWDDKVKARQDDTKPSVERQALDN